MGKCGGGVRFGLVLLWSCLALHSDPYPSGTKLLVRVNSHAGLPSRTLSRAQDRVSQVFKRAGFEMHWLDCGVGTTVSIDIHILPKFVEGAQHEAFSAFGVTLATRITVFYDKVRDFAKWYSLPESEVLALVVAHELGHVLLGPGHSSEEGIMMARPKPHHIRAFSGGQLQFTQEQATLMQANVRSCNCQIDGPPALSACC